MRALRDTTVDLIKYENLKAYREHVMSKQFQADTIQLVKVDLPAIAASAAKRGSEGLVATTTAFKEEVDRYSSKLAALVPSETELKAVADNVRTAGGNLLVELQAELRLGVDHVKSEVRARPASGHLPPHLPPISRRAACHPLATRRASPSRTPSAASNASSPLSTRRSLRL